MTTRKKRIIGIDFGFKRIGVSYSDETKMIAMPLTVVTAEKKSAATLAKVVALLLKHAEEYHYDIEAIVIGKPLLMSGKSGFMADEASHFLELLKKSIQTEYIFWDERLSSMQAERALMESTLTRKERSKKVDTVAAVIILQSYLDHLRLQKEKEERDRLFQSEG